MPSEIFEKASIHVNPRTLSEAVVENVLSENDVCVDVYVLSISVGLGTC